MFQAAVKVFIKSACLLFDMFFWSSHMNCSFCGCSVLLYGYLPILPTDNFGKDLQQESKNSMQLLTLGRELERYYWLQCRRNELYRTCSRKRGDHNENS